MCKKAKIHGRLASWLLSYGFSASWLRSLRFSGFVAFAGFVLGGSWVVISYKWGYKQRNYSYNPYNRVLISRL